MKTFDEWYGEHKEIHAFPVYTDLEAAWKAAIAEAVKVIRSYEVSVGNSPAGEIACDMTIDNLREIVRELEGEVKGE